MGGEGAIAMTTLFLTAQGLAVTDSGYRRFVAPHWLRGLSYLKIGWNWAHSALTKNWDFFSSYFFTSNTDLDPAIASRKLHLHKLYRIEFSASTSNWAS